MERTKWGNVTKESLIKILVSQIQGRALLASKMGVQFGGKREIYAALGYPDDITFQDFLGRYLRQDIAKAIIDRPVKATWQGDLELIETDAPEKTTFEQAWIDLDRRLRVKNRLLIADRLTGIGRYGVLFLGLNDVKKITDFKAPVKKNGKLQLTYIKAFSEETAKITSYVTDTSNPRYGMPEIYTIQTIDNTNGSGATVDVHYSRIIHIIDNALESDIYGLPRLQAVYNRLMDLDKVIGGDGEMFWRGARPGYQGKVDKDYQITQATKDELDEQLDEYDNKLRRFLINEGIVLEPLEQQIADPSKHVDVILTAISAETGIPKRVLSGSERGELASSQDTGEWKTYIQARREDFAEPMILRPFVDLCIEYGILPKPSVDYRVDWLDLFAISEKERVEIGKSRASAIREYTTNPGAQALLPPDAFFEVGLGLSTGQIELIHKMIEKGISEDQKELMEEIQEIVGKAGSGEGIIQPDGNEKPEEVEETEEVTVKEE